MTALPRIDLRAHHVPTASSARCACGSVREVRVNPGGGHDRVAERRRHRAETLYDAVREGAGSSGAPDSVAEPGAAANWRGGLHLAPRKIPFRHDDAGRGIRAADELRRQPVRIEDFWYGVPS